MRFAPKVKFRQGWRDIGGKDAFYRSRWEANFARYLEWLKVNGHIQDWEHEPETFWFNAIKRGVRSYLPDFRVTETDGRIVYYEVKGYMDAKSKTKIKRFAKYYPDLELRVIKRKEYMEIQKRLGAVIPRWEK